MLTVGLAQLKQTFAGQAVSNYHEIMAGAVLAVLLLVMIDPLEALWFLVFLVALQQLEGNLIYPRVVGTSMGLPGIWVLAAVTVGGALLQLVGMVISVPLAAVAYTLLKQDLRARTAAQSAAPQPDSEEAPPQN